LDALNSHALDRGYQPAAGGEKHGEEILYQPQLGWDEEKEGGAADLTGEGNPKVLARFLVLWCLVNSARVVKV